MEYGSRPQGSHFYRSRSPQGSHVHRSMIGTMSFQSIVRHSSGIAIFNLQGRLVGLEGESLHTQMLRQFDTNHHRMLLNCELVDSADSLGVGDLVAAHASIVRRGGQVKILRPHRRLLEILRITRLDGLFDINEDEAKAIASFNNAADVVRARAALSNYLGSE